jgi:hypothetical protein
VDQIHRARCTGLWTILTREPFKSRWRAWILWDRRVIFNLILIIGCQMDDTDGLWQTGEALGLSFRWGHHVRHRGDMTSSFSSPLGSVGWHRWRATVVTFGWNSRDGEGALQCSSGLTNVTGRFLTTSSCSSCCWIDLSNGKISCARASRVQRLL